MKIMRGNWFQSLGIQLIWFLILSEATFKHRILWCKQASTLVKSLFLSFPINFATQPKFYKKCKSSPEPPRVTVRQKIKALSFIFVSEGIDTNVLWMIECWLYICRQCFVIAMAIIVQIQMCPALSLNALKSYIFYHSQYPTYTFTNKFAIAELLQKIVFREKYRNNHF